ncbi:LysM peptidoglycan-binding domain-containing protein [Sporolactobacillus sp. THM7-7]|nr:LysM peptidoglycan-binding domain-containing protein [Sporolactobacillus sp. THM7-7]
MKKIMVPAAVIGGLFLSAGGHEAFAAGGDALVNKALGFQGKPYEYGAPAFSTASFDCSSFTQFIYKTIAGVTLPRTSAAQAAVGTPVDKGSLQTGDLLFFDTDNNGSINHVGIYIGNGQMISAESTVGVHVTNVFSGGGSENYWSPLFRTARRVALPSGQEAASHAQQTQPAARAQTGDQPGQPSSSQGSVYTVQSGDSLWRIARQNGLSVNDLKSMNNLQSDLIFPGQQLKLAGVSSSDVSEPAVQTSAGNQTSGGTYEVKSGDSLWEIATLNGTTVNQLMRANNLSSIIIYPGQHLVLPR